MTKRRTVLLGALAGAGALVLGWSLLPHRQRLNTAQALPTRVGQVALNGWLKIGADDSVGIVMAKSEMGQGVLTGLAMLLAEELDADWSRVRIEAAPIDKIYNNLVMVADGLPFHLDTQGGIKSAAQWMTGKLMREVGVMATGGSFSIKDLWLPMRQAGAAARAMLVAAAAEQCRQLPRVVDARVPRDRDPHHGQPGASRRRGRARHAAHRPSGGECLVCADRPALAFLAA